MDRPLAMYEEANSSSHKGYNHPTTFITNTNKTLYTYCITLKVLNDTHLSCPSNGMGGSPSFMIGQHNAHEGEANTSNWSKLERSIETKEANKEGKQGNNNKLHPTPKLTSPKQRT